MQSQQNGNLALATMSVMAVVSCSNTPGISSGHSGFADRTIYKSSVFADKFSTKTLTKNYIKMKLVKWLTDPVKGEKLVKEVDYARIKYSGTFATLMSENPAILFAIKNVAEVQAREAVDAPFKAFLDGLNRVIIVSTIAGTGASGYTEGNGTAAEFRSPTGVAVDSAGNIYIAERFNNVIRKIDNSVNHVVSTIAGTG